MSTEITPKKTLADYAKDLENLCQQMETMADAEQPEEIPAEFLAQFTDARLSLADKTNRMIIYLDSLKMMVTALEERKQRAARSHKVMANAQERLRNYCKYVLESHPDLNFSGEEGTLYLAKSPSSVELDFGTGDVSLRGVVDYGVIAANPSLLPYVKKHEYYTINKTLIKEDLAAGMQLDFAKINQDKHVRIKGQSKPKSKTVKEIEE